MFEKPFVAFIGLSVVLFCATVSDLHAQTTDAVAPLALTPCRIDGGDGMPSAKAQCGVLQRAENPDDPDGKKIELQIALVPALSVQPEPDPLIFFAGGPGQGAIDSYLALRGAFEPIRQNRDILLIDQRGTGGSNLMTCALPDEDVTAAGFDMEIAIEETRKCLQQLAGDPRFYTTSIAVDDVNAVRQALGFDQVNLWGGSYGTRVALHYLRKYPESTRSVIIDGVIAADQILGPDIAIAAEKSIQLLFSRCTEDEACQARFGDLDSRFKNLKERLTETPITVSIQHPRTAEIVDQRISGDELAGVIRMAAYQPIMRALAPLMISEAFAGRYDMLAANAVSLNDSFTDLLAIGMHNSVVCSEDAPRFSDDPSDVAKREATFMGNVQFEYLKETCKIWPRGPVDSDFHEPVVSDIPVMLLSGEYDPVTPPANADRAMRTLSNAIHIVAPQQGHIASGLGCIPDLLGDFVKNINPSAIDDSCVKRLRGMPIFVSPTGPTP